MIMRQAYQSDEKRNQGAIISITDSDACIRKFTRAKKFLIKKKLRCWEAVWEYHLHVLRSALPRHDAWNLERHRKYVKPKDPALLQNACALHQARDFFPNRRCVLSLP